jgi:O-antigen/teichoic acid export membrane protein
MAAPLRPGATLWARFQTGIIYNTLGAVFNQGSTFVFSMIVANLLGQRVFGEYAMIQSTLATLSVFAQMAGGSAATKYIAEFRSTDPERAGRILGMLLVFSTSLAALVSLSLLAFSGWLAVAIFKAPELRRPLAIAAAVLFFAVPTGLAAGALAGLESYRALARALVWSGFSYILICTVFARFRGLNGALMGLALSGVLQFVLLVTALRKECALQKIRIQYAGLARERSIFLKFVLPGALSGLTTMPALWLASAFLVRQPNGYSQLAIYSAAFSLMTVVMFLPNMANGVSASLINHKKGAGEEAGYRHAFWLNLTVTVVIVTLGAGVFAVFGQSLLCLFGKDFSGAYPVLLILLLASVVQGFVLAVYQIIQSQARMWFSFFAVALPRDAAVVGFAALLIPHHGAIGVAIAYALACTLALASVLAASLQGGLRASPQPVSEDLYSSSGCPNRAG